MNTDNWVPLSSLEARESTLKSLHQLFAAMRDAAGSIGPVMDDRDCLQELLASAVPFLTARLKNKLGTSDLAFHSTDDLVKEMASRFAQLLIAGEFAPQPGITYLHIQHFGSKISAIGLADYARAVILSAVDNGPMPPGFKIPDMPTKP